MRSAAGTVESATHGHTVADPCSMHFAIAKPVPDSKLSDALRRSLVARPRAEIGHD